MIDVNDLTHTVQYKRISDDPTEDTDDYGQPVKEEVSMNERCFYDFPKDEIILTENERKIKVEAILFMHPDSDIQLDDLINSVKDQSGSYIVNRNMRVSNIRKANDNLGIHHLEVMLSAI